MVKKDSGHSALTTMMHFLQIAGSAGIIAFAASEVSLYEFAWMRVYTLRKILTFSLLMIIGRCIYFTSNLYRRVYGRNNQ